MFSRSMGFSTLTAVMEAVGLATKPCSTADAKNSSIRSAYITVECEPYSPTSNSPVASGPSPSPSIRSPGSSSGGQQQQESLLGESQSSTDPDFADTSFDLLCNNGAKWSWANWRVKLYRWTLLWPKAVYLAFLVLSVPTNYLMVSFSHLGKGFLAAKC
jgi:hypothetical protein